MRQLYDRLLDVLWKLDREKPTRGVEVVFAFFIYDANHLMLKGFRIFENLVDFSQFQRGFVFFVSDADREVLLFSHASLDEAFDFHSPFADSVRLKPVDLSFGYRTIWQAYGSDSLELPPVAFPVQPIQPIENVDGAPGGDGLDRADLADYFKFHACRLTQRVPLSAQRPCR
jgi:hypothetical protein